MCLSYNEMRVGTGRKVRFLERSRDGSSTQAAGESGQCIWTEETMSSSLLLLMALPGQVLCLQMHALYFIYFIFKENIFIDFFTERKGGGQRVRNIDERETLISCLLHTPYWAYQYARNQGTCP